MFGQKLAKASGTLLLKEQIMIDKALLPFMYIVDCG